MATTSSVTSRSRALDRLRSAPVDMFIDGAWVSVDRRFPVIDPATEEVIADIADGTADDGLRALDAAAGAQAEWGALLPGRRAEILRRAYDLMMERRDEFVDTMVLESGKPRSEADAEFALSAGFLLWFVEQIAHLGGGYSRGAADGYRVITTSQPVGPALLITPWNFPLLMGARKMGAALAAGCTVIIKSAQETPLTIGLLVDTLDRAGLPAGVVNLVHTTESGKLSSALLADRRLRKVSFTGSTGVGSLLLSQAAKNIVNSSMELGGNGPFVVLDDADLDLAVREAIICKFRNAGQACVAANRIILQKGIAAEFSERFVEATRQLQVGDGFGEATTVGPVISSAQRARVDKLAHSAVRDGATLLTGGRMIDGPGFFYEPTVLSNVPRGSSLACDELFGPVAVLYEVDTVAEAVEFANDTEYGLASYIFTGDVARAITIAEQLETGMVAINRGVMADPAAPFGGVKASGIGREGGEHGIEEFLEPKYIALTVQEG